MWAQRTGVALRIRIRMARSGRALPAVDFAVKTTRFMLCIESSRDNKMFADAYKGALRSHVDLTLNVDMWIGG